MSIRTELDKTALYLRNARNAVIGRGGEISATAGFKDLPDAITNIPNDQTLAWQTIESNAKQVIVPNGVLPIAQIKKIGGITYKSENILNPVWMGDNGTQFGFTVVKNDDGTISVNGTGSGSGYDNIFDIYAYSNGLLCEDDVYFSIEEPLPEGMAIVIWSQWDPENSSAESADWIYGDTTSVKIQNKYISWISLTFRYDLDSHQTVTANNITIKPMFSRGSVKSFEPYFKGLRDSKVTSIMSEGVNLLDISQAVNTNFVDNGDGTYTITNNGGVERFSKVFPIFIPANTTVTIKGFKVSGEINCLLQFRFADGTWWEDCPYFDGVARKRTPEKDIISARFFVNSGTTNEGKPVTIRDIQIQYGTTATEYKPYVGTIAIHDIPEVVTSREEYCEGVNADYYNYIEWRDGRYYEEQTCKKLVFNGTEGWYAGSLGTESQYFAIEGYALPAVANGGIMNDYEATSIGSSNTRIGWQLYTNKFLIRLRPANVLTNFPTLADWKAHLAERYANGNPLTFVYALAEPIETDITDLMTVDNHIAVEGCGSIQFINEHGYPVQNEINYLFNTIGG